MYKRKSHKCIISDREGVIFDFTFSTVVQHTENKHIHTFLLYLSLTPSHTHTHSCASEHTRVVRVDSWAKLLLDEPVTVKGVKG